MSIEETTDNFLLPIWRIYEGLLTVAIAHSEHDAKVIKEALERDREEKARQESVWW